MGTVRETTYQLLRELGMTVIFGNPTLGVLMRARKYGLAKFLSSKGG